MTQWPLWHRLHFSETENELVSFLALAVTYWLLVRSPAFRAFLICWCFCSAGHAYVCQDNSLWFAPWGKIRSIKCSDLALRTGLAWPHFVFVVGWWSLSVLICFGLGCAVTARAGMPLVLGLHYVALWRCGPSDLPYLRWLASWQALLPCIDSPSTAVPQSEWDESDQL